MKKSEGKRFAVFEDLPEWQSMIRRALTESGHIVAARATTLAEALALIPKLKELKVQAITLDGNLREEAPSGYQPGDDAKEIIKALRKDAPKVKIIGMSIDQVDDADINIRKPPEFKLKEHLEYAIRQVFSKK